MSKKVIHFDENHYKLEETRQARMQHLFNVILQEAEKANLEISDYKEFIKEPVEYCTNKYWEVNSKFFPAGITKEKAIKGTDFNDTKVNHAFSEYKQIGKTCKGIKINKSTTGLNLNKEDYNWHLSDEKKNKYEALEKLLEVIEDLEKYTNVNHHSILRAVDTDCFLIHNARLRINAQYYR